MKDENKHLVASYVTTTPATMSHKVGIALGSHGTSHRVCCICLNIYSKWCKSIMKLTQNIDFPACIYIYIYIYISFNYRYKYIVILCVYIYIYTVYDIWNRCKFFTYNTYMIHAHSFSQKRSPRFQPVHPCGQRGVGTLRLVTRGSGLE